MVDTVRFINAEHNVVRVEPEGWNTPYPSNTWHQERIKQWEEGRTDAWDEQKEAYDRYMLIMGYEDALIQFEEELVQCRTDYNTCVVDENQFNCDQWLESCLVFTEKPKVPFGYNSQEEVDESVLASAQWAVDKLFWEDNPENTEDYPIIAPRVLLRPAELPVIAEPSILVPNVIPDYVKPVNEVRAEKLLEIQAKFNIEANVDVISNGQTWNGGIANALAINGDSDLQAHRGRPEATIHSKDHVAHVMNVAIIKDIAADIGEAYDTVNAKLHVKLKAINDCADDAACIIGINW